ncbi:golgin subfamily A member 6-like protein 6 [Palaemon carinicauda]|uniref:golgin subfamily A member 6-like protein 6 n=1 Tax=Palaemon carinicauda TaxID=392227 RepID=UPI0035B6265F
MEEPLVVSAGQKELEARGAGNFSPVNCMEAGPIEDKMIQIQALQEELQKLREELKLEIEKRKELEAERRKREEAEGALETARAIMQEMGQTALEKDHYIQDLLEKICERDFVIQQRNHHMNAANGEIIKLRETVATHQKTIDEQAEDLRNFSKLSNFYKQNKEIAERGINFFREMLVNFENNTKETKRERGRERMKFPTDTRKVSPTDLEWDTEQEIEEEEEKEEGEEEKEIKCDEDQEVTLEESREEEEKDRRTDTTFPKTKIEESLPDTMSETDKIVLMNWIELCQKDHPPHKILGCSENPTKEEALAAYNDNCQTWVNRYGNFDYCTVIGCEGASIILEKLAESYLHLTCSQEELAIIEEIMNRGYEDTMCNAWLMMKDIDVEELMDQEDHDISEVNQGTQTSMQSPVEDRQLSEGITSRVNLPDQDVWKVSEQINGTKENLRQVTLDGLIDRNDNTLTKEEEAKEKEESFIMREQSTGGIGDRGNESNRKYVPYEEENKTECEADQEKTSEESREEEEEEKEEEQDGKSDTPFPKTEIEESLPDTMSETDKIVLMNWIELCQKDHPPHKILGCSENPTKEEALAAYNGNCQTWVNRYGNFDYCTVKGCEGASIILEKLAESYLHLTCSQEELAIIEEIMNRGYEDTMCNAWLMMKDIDIEELMDQEDHDISEVNQGTQTSMQSPVEDRKLSEGITSRVNLPDQDVWKVSEQINGTKENLRQVTLDGLIDRNDNTLTKEEEAKEKEEPFIMREQSTGGVGDRGNESNRKYVPYEEDNKTECEADQEKTSEESREEEEEEEEEKEEEQDGKSDTPFPKTE